MTQQRPSWLPVDREYASVRSRFGLRARFGRMLTGILPTVVLEQHWPTEQLDMFGINASTDGGVAGEFHACSLFNRSDDLELLVWQVTAFVVNFQGTTRGFPVHIFTPLQTYDPTVTPAATPPAPADGLFFPMLQTAVSVGIPGLVGDAVVEVGSNPSLQVLTVDGLARVSIGPRKLDFNGWTESAFQFPLQNRDSHVNLGVQASPAPPLRVKPQQRLCVQSTSTMQGPGGGTSQALEANFIYSQRPFFAGR